MIENWRQTLSFIWSGKEILRDHYKRHQYGEVLLPLCVLRRFDCVLEETKSAVLRKAEQLGGNQDNSYDLLRHVAGPQLYNTSQFTFQSLLNDQDNIGENLTSSTGSHPTLVRLSTSSASLVTSIEWTAPASCSPSSVCSLQLIFIRIASAIAKWATYTRSWCELLQISRMKKLASTSPRKRSSA